MGGVLIEKIPAELASFRQEVERQIIVHNVQHLRVNWFDPDLRSGAKEGRQRSLQLLHEQGLLRFVIGLWTDEVTKQLIEYNGDPKLHGSSKGGRHDDLIDSMSFILKVLPYIPGIQTDQEKLLAAAALVKKQMEEQNRWIFGSNNNVNLNPTSSAPPQPTWVNPIYRALDKLNRKKE